MVMPNDPMSRRLRGGQLATIPPQDPDGGFGRWAGDLMGIAIKPETYTSWKGAIGKRLPLGRFGVPALGLGAGALTGLMAAGSELNNPDPTVGDLQRMGGATGAFTGSGLGTAIGATLGGMTPLGPLGALAGGAIGGSLGGSLGGGAGRGVAGLFEASPESRALRAYEQQSNAALEAELKRATALAPIQQQMAEAANNNEIDRARKMQAIQSLAMAFDRQQQASAAQSLAATQGLFNMPYGMG